MEWTGLQSHDYVILDILYPFASSGFAFQLGFLFSKTCHVSKMSTIRGRYSHLDRFPSYIPFHPY
jgi:hypothetical protein